MPLAAHFAAALILGFSVFLSVIEILLSQPDCAARPFDFFWRVALDAAVDA